MRFDDLKGIFDRYDTAQNELELSDNTDHFGDRELFENQYYEFKAKFSELLHPVIDTIRSRNSTNTSQLHSCFFHLSADKWNIKTRFHMKWVLVNSCISHWLNPLLKKLGWIRHYVQIKNKQLHVHKLGYSPVLV